MGSWVGFFAALIRPDGGLRDEDGEGGGCRDRPRKKLPAIHSKCDYVRELRSRIVELNWRSCSEGSK